MDSGVVVGHLVVNFGSQRVDFGHWEIILIFSDLFFHPGGRVWASRSRFSCLGWLILVQDFWALKIDFGPQRLDLGLYEYILSLIDSILNLRELCSGFYETILGFESHLGHL